MGSWNEDHGVGAMSQNVPFFWDKWDIYGNFLIFFVMSSAAELGGGGSI
jgi:hypothetical protein